MSLAPQHGRQARPSSPRVGRLSARNGRTGTRGPRPACRADPSSGTATEIKVPAAIAPGTFDPQQLAELNAKYQARWEALWSAAIAALAPDAQGPRPIPDVTHPAPGDRRFAAREWRELPYFALLKQGYLLFGEYLNELATLGRAAGARQAAGSSSSRSSSSMRSRRRISWRPIPRC